MHIRPATNADAPAIWRIIGPVIRAGETYALDRDMSEAAAVGWVERIFRAKRNAT